MGIKLLENIFKLPCYAGTPPLPFYNTYYYCVNTRNHLVSQFPPRLTWTLNYWKTTLRSHVYKGFPFINLSTTPIFAYYLTYLVARCKMFRLAEYTHPMFTKGSPPPSTYTTTVKSSPPSPSIYATSVLPHKTTVWLYSPQKTSGKQLSEPHVYQGFPPSP